MFIKKSKSAGARSYIDQISNYYAELDEKFYNGLISENKLNRLHNKLFEWETFYLTGGNQDD